MKVALSHVRGWTLETMEEGKFTNNHMCNVRGYGLLRERYFFEEPKNGNVKCAKFTVKGLSVYGYAEFKRIT